MRLIGNVSADPQHRPADRDLRRTTRRSPSAPSRLQFNGGGKAPLSSPPICANTTTAQISPWSGNAAATPDRHPRPEQRPRRRRLRENDGRAALLAGLQGRAEKRPTRSPSRRSRSTSPAPTGQQELKGVDITLPPGRHREAGRRPLLPSRRRSPRPRRRPVRPRRRTRAVPARARSASPRSPPAPAPRRCRSSGKAFLAGPYKGAPLSLVVVTPARRRPLRPRHRRGQGAALPRSGNGPDPRRLRPDPGCLRRRQARHPLDRGQRQQEGIHPQRDQLLATGHDRGHCNGGGADPTNPATFSSFPVSDPVQLNNCEPLELPAEAEPASLRRHQARQAPAPAGRAPGPGRRRQHGPRLGRSAARALPRPGQPGDRSARAPSSPPTAARRNRSTDKAQRVHAAARPTARRPGLPALVEQHPARPGRPPAKARSTSTWSAASTASRAASAPPSTASPTCRSRSSR